MLYNSQKIMSEKNRAGNSKQYSHLFMLYSVFFPYTIDMCVCVCECMCVSVCVCVCVCGCTYACVLFHSVVLIDLLRTRIMAH